MTKRSPFVQGDNDESMDLPLYKEIKTEVRISEEIPLTKHVSPTPKS